MKLIKTKNEDLKIGCINNKAISMHIKDIKTGYEPVLFTEGYAIFMYDDIIYFATEDDDFINVVAPIDRYDIDEFIKNYQNFEKDYIEILNDNTRILRYDWCTNPQIQVLDLEKSQIIVAIRSTLIKCHIDSLYDIYQLFLEASLGIKNDNSIN